MSETEEGTAGGGAAGFGAEGAASDGSSGAVSHTVSARPLVLPETFDGTGSWTDWCFYFENVASICIKLHEMLYTPTSSLSHATLVTKPSFNQGEGKQGKDGLILRMTCGA